MEKMKYDMAGGAAMIGAMRAIAQLKPADRRDRLHSLRGEHAGQPRAAARRHCDRHVGQDHRSDQYRRRRPLILADALTYARRQGCTHLVDAATLTGAIVVALGPPERGVVRQ
jgi:leucyl aminopeptidase